MDIKDNPLAYWGFETGALKEDVRDIVSSVFMKKMRMDNPYKYTPWKLNLFRIEEFEKYNDISEQYEKLNPLRGWNGASDTIPFLSPADMLTSHSIAQRMINKDSNFKKFIKEGKRRNLNYIIQANHDGNLPSAAYNGSIVVLDLLTRLSLDFFKTCIAEGAKDFRNQLYGYYENSPEGKFVLSDGYSNEVKIHNQNL
jgi:hypothetical protein